MTTPYPNLNSNINDPNRNTTQLSPYVDPDAYSSTYKGQPTSTGPTLGQGMPNNYGGYNNAGYNTPSYNNNNNNYGGVYNNPNYMQTRPLQPMSQNNYQGPPPGYNDPNNEHY